MAVAQIRHRRFNDRAAALGGAALAHAALLAPLALGALGMELERIEDSETPVLRILLEPRSTDRRTPSPTADRATADRDPLPVLPQAIQGPTPRPALTQADTPPPADASTVIDSRWRVRPGVGGPGWGDCPEAFSVPSMQNLCNERHRLRTAAASRPVAGPPIHRVQPSDVPPSDAIARAAAANQAWRDYTRNDGPYPGLKSLFRDH